MTVKELIAELQKFDGNLLVITESTEERYAAYPRIEKYDFPSNYWDDNHTIKQILANQEHVVL